MNSAQHAPIVKEIPYLACVSSPAVLTPHSGRLQVIEFRKLMHVSSERLLRNSVGIIDFVVARGVPEHVLLFEDCKNSARSYYSVCVPTVHEGKGILLSLIWVNVLIFTVSMIRGQQKYTFFLLLEIYLTHSKSLFLTLRSDFLYQLKFYYYSC